MEEFNSKSISTNRSFIEGRKKVSMEGAHYQTLGKDNAGLKVFMRDLPYILMFYSFHLACIQVSQSFYTIRQFTTTTICILQSQIYISFISG